MKVKKVKELINLLKSLDCEDFEFIQCLKEYLILGKKQQKQFVSIMEYLMKNDEQKQKIK